MKAKTTKNIVLSSVLLFSLGTQIHADNSSLPQSITDIVNSASDCEVLAYDVGLETYDADKTFR